jgi:hypothetical protein
VAEAAHFAMDRTLLSVAGAFAGKWWAFITVVLRTNSYFPAALLETSRTFSVAITPNAPNANLAVDSTLMRITHSLLRQMWTFVAVVFGGCH